MGGGRHKRAKHASHGNVAENLMAKAVDDLSAFEEFQRDILPMIRKDMTRMSPEQLREKYQSYVQARLITTALSDPDAARATAAAKDIMDRAEGKAKERQEITHQLQNLPDEQLDALLNTSMEQLSSQANKLTKKQ